MEEFDVLGGDHLRGPVAKGRQRLPTTRQDHEIGKVLKSDG